MTFLSLFSGIGGLDLGLERAGMRCVGQVEIDRQANTVLAHHWPKVKRHADITRFRRRNAPVRADLICGGFPCQDVSVAGRRAGLAGAKSGLWWEFHRVLSERLPGWVLIENVPGLLSSNGGRDMGAIVGALAELGYGWAYRVLDSRWFRVPQQRRRVFIVGCFGNWRRAAEVLFERQSLPWDSEPGRETGQAVARAIACGSVSSGYRLDPTEETFVVAHTLRASWDGSEDGTGRGVPLVIAQNGSDVQVSTQCGTLNAGMARQTSGPLIAGTLASSDGGMDCQRTGELVVAFFDRTITSKANRSNPQPGDPCCTLAGALPPLIVPGVRRLTPLECLRLQGFPDDWFDGLKLSDSAKYRLCGNAVSVPVAEWIGRRIVSVS